ncbi:putative exostosin [Helianthus anomalus]
MYMNICQKLHLVPAYHLYCEYQQNSHILLNLLSSLTKAEAAKVAKHEKACIENQHVFVPFAFDTFGALVPDAVRLLKRVQQVLSSNTAHVKGQNFVFSRVGFAIEKGVAAQLVARLPVISL